MNFENLAPYLAGPGAAVLVLLLVGAGVYRLAVQYLIPVLQGAVNRHLEELERSNQRGEDAVNRHLSHVETMGQRYDALAKQHAEEHRAILVAVESMNTATKEHQERLERKVGGLYGRFDSLTGNA